MADSGGFSYRIGNTEKRLDMVEQITNDVPLIRRDIETLVKEVAEVREEIKSGKRATWAVFIAIFGVGISLVANVLIGAIG